MKKRLLSIDGIKKFTNKELKNLASVTGGRSTRCCSAGSFWCIRHNYCKDKSTGDRTPFAGCPGKQGMD